MVLLWWGEARGPRTRGTNRSSVVVLGGDALADADRVARGFSPAPSQGPPPRGKGVRGPRPFQAVTGLGQQAVTACPPTCPPKACRRRKRQRRRGAGYRVLGQRPRALVVSPWTLPTRPRVTATRSANLRRGLQYGGVRACLGDNAPSSLTLGTLLLAIVRLWCARWRGSGPVFVPGWAVVGDWCCWGGRRHGHVGLGPAGPSPRYARNKPFLGGGVGAGTPWGT